MTAPTGEQHLITLGDARAVITEVAAALREFSAGGIDIAQPYPESATPPFAAGIVLVPWANRVDAGLWHLDGKAQQLDITEPARNNAIHGLLRYTGYQLVERTESSVVLGAHVFPQHGYPFHLETTVSYELVPGGLRVSHGIRNLSSAPAPVAIGTHPFLTIGDVPAEQLVLTVHAATRFEVDERLLPVAELPVDGTRFDLRGGIALADLDLDTAFGAVATVQGASATLRAPDGREVSLRQDENYPYVQVFTPRTFPTKGGPGLAVAIEPMTAAPNAFNTGAGLHWIAAGESWNVEWGIGYSW